MNASNRVVKTLLCLSLAALPLLLYGRSAVPPPVRRTGAAVDGGLNCAACHSSLGSANSDPRGSVRIEAANYRPGVRQILRVIVEHPEATRWGFQLTAREVTDPSRKAGTLHPTPDIWVTCDGSTTPSPTPCEGTALEFASHTTDSTRTGGQNGRKIFEVEWTPPANEIGRIVLYAAGNAANNSGNNQGDRIYTTSVELEAEGSCTQTTRPTLQSVVNGASFTAGIGLNSMITIFGRNFALPGRTRAAGPGDFVANSFPKKLECVAVEVDGQRVPIAYVQTDQINAQAPTITRTGPVNVRVILNPDSPSELRSDDAPGIPFQTFSPAFFLFGSSRSIAAQHTDFTPLASPTVVPGARAARPGQVVILYGTGFGITEPVYQAGERPEGLARLRDPFTITVGGTTLAQPDILYAGLSPLSISGLYQFNLRLPATLTAGEVPVSIRIGGVTTQANTTIPVVLE